MTVPRVVMGDRLGDGNVGLHVSLPGINALTDDTQNPLKFALSTDWALPMRIPQAGTVGCNVWVSLLEDPGFMPFIVFRAWTGAANDVGAINRTNSYAPNSRYIITAADHLIHYQTLNGIRQFSIQNWNAGGQSTSGTTQFFYWVTNLEIYP